MNPYSTRTRHRRWRAGAVLLAAALLSSCGGGTQVERFVPARVIALGDETSVLNADGSKYTINAASTTDGSPTCASNLTWIQVLARAYGRVFGDCNPSGAAISAYTYAAVGAKVADIALQTTQIGPIAQTDLITVLAGQNDILEQYARYPGVSEAQLIAELELTGAQLAAQVNVLSTVGKVLIATVPDLGLTPFAAIETSTHADVDRAGLLSRLTERFNATLRANIDNDGTRIGLLLLDEVIQADWKAPATYGFVNVTDAACLDTAPLPACTTDTLQPANGTLAAATSLGWLWADTIHMSPGGHNQLGALAATRTNGNPF